MIEEVVFLHPRLLTGESRPKYWIRISHKHFAVRRSQVNEDQGKMSVRDQMEDKNVHEGL